MADDKVGMPSQKAMDQVDTIKNYGRKAMEFLGMNKHQPKNENEQRIYDAAQKGRSERKAALGDLEQYDVGTIGRTSDIPERHKGGPVTHSGPHNLLKGEHVLDKKKAEQYRSAGHVLGGKPEHSGDGEHKEHEVHGAHVKKLKSGGFHIHHHDQHGMPIPGAEHAVPDMAALHDHLAEHLGGGEEANPAAEEAEQVSA